MEHLNTRIIRMEVFPPKGTTNRTLVSDLSASLVARRGVPAGLTYGDFKEAMRQLGVTDDMPLASIEYGCSRYGNGRLTLDTASDGVEIREGK
jgi:hypothetical protein